MARPRKDSKACKPVGLDSVYEAMGPKAYEAQDASALQLQVIDP